MSAVAHSSILFGLPLAGPLLVLFGYPLVWGRSSFVKKQALTALVFHGLVTILLFILTVLGGFFWFLFIIGWPIAFVCWIASGFVFIASWVLALNAVIKTLQGATYYLPFTASIVNKLL
jgi:uncharacterized Tic20 family protein